MKKQTVGLFIEDVRDYHRMVRSGAAAVVREQEANLITVVGGALNDPQRLMMQENIVYDLITPERVDGVMIMAGLGNFIPPEAFAVFCQRYAPLPVVVIGTRLEQIPSVVIDDESAWRDLLEHLIIEHGSRRIAFLKGIEHNPDAKLRYQVYADLLTAHHLPLDPDLILPGDFTFEAGVRAMHTLLDRRAPFDAVAAANDRMALGAMQVLREQGIFVPERIAVIGFGDLQESQVSIPPLSTIRQPCYQLGMVAAEMLLAQLRGDAVPDVMTLSTSMVVRQSCGCPPQALLEARDETLPLASGECASQVDFRPPNAEQKAKMLGKLQQIIGDWAEGIQLLDALFSELQQPDMPTFLLSFMVMCKRWILADKNLAVWQDALSLLRRHLLPYLTGTPVQGHAEHLWHHARLMLAEMLQQTQAAQHLHDEQRRQTLRDVSHALSTAFEIAHLSDALAHALPRLNISNGYLCMYDASQVPGDFSPVPEWSRLLLAVTDQQRLDNSANRRSFHSWRLLPDDVWPRQQQADVVLMPFSCQDQPLGFGLFDAGQCDGVIFDTLQKQISAALHVARLLESRKCCEEELLTQRQHLEEAIKEQTAELAAANARLQQEIAERIQAQNALAQEHNVLRALLDHLPDYIYVKDTASRFVLSNDANTRSLGFTTQDQVLGKTDFDLFPPEQAQVFYAEEQAIMTSGEPLINLERLGRDPETGQAYWGNTKKVPFRDQHGTIAGIVGISRDITIYKQVEEELKRHRNHLEELVKERTAELRSANQQLGQEIAERKRTERLLTQALKETQELLAAAQDILGIPSMQELCQNLIWHSQNLVHADEVTLFVVDLVRQTIRFRMRVGDPNDVQWSADISTVTYDELTRGISGLVFTSREPVLSLSADDGIEPQATAPRRKNLGIGSLIVVPLLARGEVIGTITALNRIERRPFTPHEMDLLMALATQAAIALENARLFDQAQQEIRERQTAENALAEERNLLRILIDNLPDAVFIKDTNSRFLALNEATARLMDATAPKEVLGKTDFDFYSPELAQQYAEQEQALLLSGEPILNLEECRYHQDAANPFWLVVTKIPFKDQQGIVRGLVGICHDITDRKQTEDALQQAHAELTLVVAEELRQRQIAESLREIAVILNSSLDLKSVLDKIMAQLQRVVQYDSAAILLQDGENLVVYSGLEIPESVKGKALSFASDDPAIRVFRQNAPLRLANVLTDPDWQIWPETEQIRSWIGVPLFASETVLGVLTVDRFTVDAYRAEDVRVLQIFANQAALAIYNARRFEIEARLHQEAETLRAATQALSTTLNLQQVFELILSELRKVVPYNSVSVQQLHGRFLEIIGGEGFPNLSEVLGIRFDITSPDNPNYEVIHTRAPVIIDDVQALYEVFREGPHMEAYIHSWLGVPLLFGDQLLGMISLDHHKPGFYTQDHANVAMAFASQAAIAIRNAQLYQEMRREKQLFETLMLNIPVATVMTDPNGAISLWNPAAERLFGYSKAEAVGQPLDLIVVSPAMREEGMVYTRQVFAGETIHSMTRRCRKDGALVDVELFAVPVMLEQERVAVLALYHDITELKQAEAKLIAANNELHETLDDLQRTQNQLIAAEKMAALGKLVANIAHEINTPLGAIRASVENISRTIRQTLQTLPDFLCNLSPERRHDFLTILHGALQKDSTLSAKEERKIKRELAKELQGYQLDYAPKIAELLVNLGIYINLSDFLPLLNDPAHPAILDMAYRLSWLHESVETILLATERASKVVFALKTYTRYDHCGEMVAINLVDSIEAVLTLYQNHLKQGIEVVKRYAAAPPIRCYPNELNQVWTNLIHNAIQSMQGKGRLEITVKTCEVSETSQVSGVAIEITDSGPGIPNAIKDRIFEPFFTTKPAGEGSGLGLDICRKIIDKHQGAIEFDSQPGRTTFRVILPLAPAKSA